MTNYSATLTNTLVRSYMTLLPVSVRADENLALAYRLMRDNEFRHLPVTDKRNAVVGMLSDRDLRAVQVALDFVHEEPEEGAHGLTAGDIMSKEVQTVVADDPLEVAASFMVDHGFNALPVVEDGQLVGIITSTDLMRSMIDAL